MTATSDPTAQPGSEKDSQGAGRWWERQMIASDGPDGSFIPSRLLLDRLDAQVQLFSRAGYRLEARRGVRAMMVAEPQGLRLGRAVAMLPSQGLSVVPRLLRRRTGGHRVMIVVDREGAVRLNTV